VNSNGVEAAGLSRGKSPLKIPTYKAQPTFNAQRIPGAFQLGLAVYIILTGDFPTIIQALAFGLPGGGGSEFAAAMATSIARDVLLLAPVLVFSRHPLGILHPLLLAVVVWPLVARVPQVIGNIGGWGGILAGIPLETPFYVGLRSLDASTVWTATAKYSGLQILALLSTYVGFWLFSAKRKLVRRPTLPINAAAFRTVLIGLFTLSILVLLAYLYARGGLVHHLTSLGLGRSRELVGLGPIVVAIHLATIAIYLWVAARPSDIKSPLFLLCLVAATASEFVKDGSRGSAIMVPAIVGLIWALRRQKVPWRMAMLLVPVMFAFIGLLGAVRTSSWSGSNAGEAWSNTGWSESFTLANQAIADRRAVSSGIPIMERGFQVSGGALLGTSYVPAVAAFVPRAFWDEKPRGTGSWYAQLFLGAESDGRGVPVSSEAEMYWNFGLPGVMILSIFYGMLIRQAYQFFWSRYPNPFVIVFYVLFITQFDFRTKSLIEFQQEMALLLVCFLIFKIFSFKGNFTATLLNNPASTPSQRELSPSRS
jgi:oligosaccharide repeat unit polymerase